VVGENRLAIQSILTSNAELEAGNHPIERYRSASNVIALEAGNHPIERYRSASNVIALEAGNHPNERYRSASQGKSFERYGAWALLWEIVVEARARLEKFKASREEGVMIQ
jgi:hypothetical protein